jgi:hypothetical protein
MQQCSSALADIFKYDSPTCVRALRWALQQGWQLQATDDVANAAIGGGHTAVSVYTSSFPSHAVRICQACALACARRYVA